MRFKPDGSMQLLETGGLVAGAFDWSDYVQESLTLEAGECLIIFTDGVTEAANPADEQFGEERLEAVLRGCGNPPAGTIIQKVLDEVLKFQAQAPVADDITLVCLKT
jgi:sigma-B regulation protein RsbU (phosphoserine phosphatase)